MAALDDRLTVLRSDVEIGAQESTQWTAAQLSETFAQRLEILTGPRSRMIKRILAGAPTKAELQVVLERYGSSITAITVELDRLGDVPEELTSRALIDLVGNDVEFWQWRYWQWVNTPDRTKDEMAQVVLTNRLTMVKSLSLNDHFGKADVIKRADDLYEVLNQRGPSSYGRQWPWLIRSVELIKKRLELAHIIRADPSFSGEQQTGGDLGAPGVEDRVLKLYQEITKLEVQLVADGFSVSVDVADKLEYDLEIVRNLQMLSPETKDRIRDWIVPHYIDAVMAGIARDGLGLNSEATARMLLIVSQIIRNKVAALVRRGTIPRADFDRRVNTVRKHLNLFGSLGKEETLWLDLAVSDLRFAANRSGDELKDRVEILGKLSQIDSTVAGQDVRAASSRTPGEMAWLDECRERLDIEFSHVRVRLVESTRPGSSLTGCWSA